MKLILVRHGQTEWNHKMMVQGRTDIPLNETGRAQAKALAERLRGKGIAAVYTGPLSRAYETGCEIAKANGCAAQKLAGFTEIQFGAWEGKEFSTLSRLYPELWKTWCQHPQMAVVEGAERLSDILARCLLEMEGVMARHGENDVIAIASHTMPIKLMIAHYIGLPQDSLHRIRIDNCGYTELEIKEGGRYGVLLTLNDVSHLKAEGLL